MDDKVLVIGYKGTDFINNDGVQVKSCKVTYIPNIEIQDGLSLGYLPLQIKLDEEVKKSLKHVPGLYKPVYTMMAGANNMPKPILTGLQFVKEVNLNELFK